MPGSDSIQYITLNEFRNLFTDTLTKKLVTAPITEAVVHEGRAFSMFCKTTVPNGESIMFQLKTADKIIHVNPTGLVSLYPDVDIEIIEAPTVTDGTVEIPVYNANRESDYDFSFDVYNNPTEVSGGTVVYADYIGGVEGKANGGGSTANTQQFILKRNTDYICKVTNNYESTTSVLITLFGYEIP